MKTTGQPPLPKFDIQGHRGARGMQPENTIPSFIAALDSGVTTVEMDVVITEDRQVVVSHEPWMSSSICSDTTGAPITPHQEKKFNMYQMTYALVSRFDCGSRGNERFPDQQKLAVSKPLLRDVIIAVENHIKNKSRYEVDYNIEIKSEKDLDGKFQPSPGEFSELVHSLIDEYLPLSRVVIQSFDFRVLKYWHEHFPKVRLSALVEEKTLSENLEALGFNPSVYSPSYKLLSREEVKECHRRKIRVIPWTVNEPGDMLALKAWDVDGFITDYPNRAAKFRQTLNIRTRK